MPVVARLGLAPCAAQLLARVRARSNEGLLEYLYSRLRINRTRGYARALLTTFPLPLLLMFASASGRGRSAARLDEDVSVGLHRELAVAGHGVSVGDAVVDVFAAAKESRTRVC